MRRFIPCLRRGLAVGPFPPRKTNKKKRKRKNAYWVGLEVKGNELEGDEFDDEAYAAERAKCEAIRAQAKERLERDGHKYISLVELADAQAEIRVEAATAPHNTIPLPVLTSQDEIVRLVLLTLLNVIYV